VYLNSGSPAASLVTTTIETVVSPTASSGSLLWGTSDATPRINSVPATTSGNSCGSERRVLISALVDDALQSFSFALARAHDRSDWFTALENDRTAAVEANNFKSNETGQKPSLLWPFFLLKVVIANSSSLESVTMMHMTLFAKIVTALLGIGNCLSNNPCLRFCAYSLLALCDRHIPQASLLTCEFQQGLDDLVHHKRLLVECAERIKSEGASRTRRHVSKYTSALISLLFMWNKRYWRDGKSRRYTCAAIKQDLQAALNMSVAGQVSEAGLKVTRISSTAISVSWLLGTGTLKTAGTELTLTLRALSDFDAFDVSSSIISVENIGVYGFHKFDKLRSGTLFEVIIKKSILAESSLSTTTAPAASTEVTDTIISSLYVATEPEEIMRMDPDSLPVNLKLSNSGLTVRYSSFIN
jgi:hypothetical protein